MNVEFDYSVGQQVKVKAVEMLGRVDSLSLDNNGKMYRVVYWNDGSRCQVWMYDWEIEPCGTSTANAERLRSPRLGGDKQDALVGQSGSQGG